MLLATLKQGFCVGFVRIFNCKWYHSLGTCLSNTRKTAQIKFCSHRLGLISLMPNLQSCNDHRTLDNFPKQYLEVQAKRWLQRMQNIQISFTVPLPGSKLSNPVTATSNTDCFRNLSNMQRLKHSFTAVHSYIVIDN